MLLVLNIKAYFFLHIVRPKKYNLEFIKSAKQKKEVVSKNN